MSDNSLIAHKYSERSYYNMVEDYIEFTGRKKEEVLKIPINIFLNIFYSLFSSEGGMQVSRYTKNSFIKDLKDTNEFQDIEFDYITKTETVDLFFQHFIEEEIYSISKETQNLTIDDLLDLYNFAKSQKDEEYAEYIKKKFEEQFGNNAVITN